MVNLPHFLPDPKFGNVEVAKFMNVLMLDGKKSAAEKIVYGAFDNIEKKAPDLFLPVLLKSSSKRSA